MTVLPKEGADFKRVTIIQGESRVSDDPNVVFTTVLGSCIAACLYDPVARVGGMNHFLLAEPNGGNEDPRSMMRYGVYAMEVLINAMLGRGARRERLRARLYGGAAMHRGFRDIGGSNSRFARDFLRAEGIVLVAEDIGGVSARRVEFRAGLGLSRCRTVTECPSPVAARPIVASKNEAGGEVEFF